MFRINNRNRTLLEESNSNHIIFAIVTNNVANVRKLINIRNYNNVLDESTGFTALQYAISSPNISNDIIKYLLTLGANPKEKIKNQEIDSFDLAIRYNKKYLFEYFNNIQDDKIIVLSDKNQILQNKLAVSEETNKYLLNSIDGYNIKINKLNEENKNKDVQISSLKRKNEETETAFNNLLKKHKK